MRVFLYLPCLLVRAVALVPMWLWQAPHTSRCDRIKGSSRLQVIIGTSDTTAIPETRKKKGHYWYPENIHSLPLRLHSSFILHTAPWPELTPPWPDPAVPVSFLWPITAEKRRRWRATNTRSDYEVSCGFQITRFLSFLRDACHPRRSCQHQISLLRSTASFFLGQDWRHPHCDFSDLVACFFSSRKNWEFEDLSILYLGF
jgi:hypothetical protein